MARYVGLMKFNLTPNLVEVKTISPEKVSDCVLVKSNFEQLLIIRIDRDFQFQGKLFERSELKGVAGKFLKGRFKGDASNAYQFYRTKENQGPRVIAGFFVLGSQPLPRYQATVSAIVCSTGRNFSWRSR